MLRHRRRADEADGRDPFIREQRVDGNVISLHDIEYARRQAGFLQ